MGGFLVNGGGGMDGLSKHMLEAACQTAKTSVMRRGRQVLIVGMAADGPHGALTFARSALTPDHALGFADALESYARQLREQVRSKEIVAR
jgi:hypothetical protein